MSCRTNCCKTFLFVLALLALAIMPTPASATGNCLADVSKANSCSANDVSIAAVLSNTVNVFQGGIPGTNQCIEQGNFSFTATFEVKTTSSSTRSNVGIFFGTGQNNALSGTCTNAILSPTHACAFAGNPPVSTATCGDLNYSEKDGSINGEPGIQATQASCGDTASGYSSSQFGAGTHAATLEVDNVKCPAASSTCPAGSNINGPCLVLPVCSSWSQPTNNLPDCESPKPDYPWVAAAVPGAPSKCTCGVIYVPVTPVTVSPIVQKACTTTNTPGPAAFTFSPNTAFPTSCDAGAEGSTVTYTVAIHSTATLSGNNTVVDQICDSAYGNVFTANGFSGPACPGGSTGKTATNVDCPPGGTNGIAPGATGTCTFTAPQGEDATVTDTVSASGHSSLNASSTFTNTQSLNSVTVTSSDAPASAAVTKGVDTLTHGCATVRYTVGVHNGSGFDENETLSAFSDTAFASITTVHNDVLGTTCGVASGSPGLGSLSGSTGAGALPASLPVGGADYQCKFDAQICGDLTTINLPTPPGGTCLGFQHVNKVTATIADDNSEGHTVSQTDNTLTENVCFSHFESSTP